MNENPQMTAYKDIFIKMEIIELPETLKIAGLTSDKLPDFQNISVFHDKYKPLLVNSYNPYTEIGISSNILNQNQGDYIFGCQVSSIDGLPDGLIGLDTGIKRFACLTFRVQPGGDLVGGADGPGDGMKAANEYLITEWIPQNRDLLYNYNYEYGYFDIQKSDKDYHLRNISRDGLEQGFCILGWIEVYKTDIQKEPEMCFYLPLK